MNPEYFLKSIARTVAFSNDKFSRKRDCHSATACYVSSDAAKDDDIIVLLGGEESDMVFHSIVLNAAYDIVSDSFPGYKRIKYDKKKIVVTYDGNLDEPVQMVPVKTITIKEFKNKYIKPISENRVRSFKHFLVEIAEPTIDAVRTEWDSMGIDHSVYERNGKITLSKIIVPKGKRLDGVGTAAMKVLINYADATKQRVVLSPSIDFGSTKARLVEFYKRFGFVENKGRNKDFSVSETMYRDPA